MKIFQEPDYFFFWYFRNFPTSRPHSPTYHSALEVLLAKLRLNPDDVLNVYLMGSRLWGTASDESDYDFVIVMKDTYNVSNGEILISVEGVDAYVCNLVTFDEGLVDHILIHLVALCVPTIFVWLQRHHFSFSFSEHFSLAQLRDTVSSEGLRTWRKAKKKFKDELKPDHSRKLIIHCLRELLLGIELASTRTILHFGAANHLFEEMKRETSEEWQFYKRKYKPIVFKLLTELRLDEEDAPKSYCERLKNPASVEDMRLARERVKDKWRRHTKLQADTEKSL